MVRCRALPMPPSATGDDCGRANKRRRCKEDAEQPVQIRDWISALPDDILVHILSLLTIREAAMAACVSTRWRHLWTMSPILILDGHNVLAEGISDGINSNEHKDPQFWDVRASKFIGKVNEILRHHRGIGIKIFKVSFLLNSTNASDLDRWVEFVAASSAKEAGFYLSEHGKAAIHPGKPYDFPLRYFAGGRGSPLCKLCLSDCSLVSPLNYGGFVSLTYLLLKNVSVGDADVSDVLSSCSALNYLRLRHCHQLVNLRTYHAQLMYLDVYSCKNLKSIVIHAKNLAIFEYHGHKLDIKYDSAPNLRRVVILSVKEAGCPLGCVTALPKLRTLLLQFCSPLEESRALQHALLFAGLKQIVLLLLTSWNESILSVAYLLKATPLVEKLQLEAYNDLQPPKKLHVSWPKDCSLKRLHTVKIGRFSGESELMELAFYLLQKSPALKTLSIDTHRRHYLVADKWDREKSEDALRCYYARGTALTNLAPRVPSTVKFRIK